MTTNMAQDQTQDFVDVYPYHMLFENLFRDNFFPLNDFH